jgi:hypothetical protein
MRKISHQLYHDISIFRGVAAPPGPRSLSGSLADIAYDFRKSPSQLFQWLAPLITGVGNNRPSSTPSTSTTQRLQRLESQSTTKRTIDIIVVPQGRNSILHDIDEQSVFNLSWLSLSRLMFASICRSMHVDLRDSVKWTPSTRGTRALSKWIFLGPLN